MSPVSPMGLDLDNRDPNEINSHITFDFENVLAEPDATHSSGCVWKGAHCCFSGWRNFCYSLISCLCGWVVSICWGMQFAFIAFFHVWCMTPCFKILEINCALIKRCYSICYQCSLAPFCEACGELFHHFRR